MDILNFGSFNQFRDLVAHKSVASLKTFRDADGNNLLMLAAKAGKLEYVKFLIDKGFEVNSVNVIFLHEENRLVRSPLGDGIWKHGGGQLLDTEESEAEPPKLQRQDSLGSRDQILISKNGCTNN